MKTIRSFFRQIKNALQPKSVENRRDSEEASRLLVMSSMWSSDPTEQSNAMKKISLALRSEDAQLASKAASNMAERGGIAFQYLRIAANDPKVHPTIRIRIQYYCSVSVNQDIEVNLSWSDIQDQVGNILKQAHDELQYHQVFSSRYFGVISKRNQQVLKYCFEINFNLFGNIQSIISFSTIKTGGVPDETDCIEVAKAFAKENEIIRLKIPTNSNLVYFGWKIK